MTDIRIITEPRVYAVGYQTVNHYQLDAFLDDHGAASWRTDAPCAAQALAEVAGRVCYMSFTNPRPGGNAAYLSHLIEARHGSVLEHAVWSFIFTGVSRSLTHELIRHRQGWSYSELSQRFVDCSDVAFVVPPAMLDGYHLSYRSQVYCGFDDDQSRRLARYNRWKSACLNSLEVYGELADSLAADAPPSLTGTDRRKWARQAARSVLPNCTETKLFATANARAIRNFLEQRCNRGADAEINRLAGALYSAVLAEAPALFGDYERIELGDGTFELTTKNVKV